MMSKPSIPAFSRHIWGPIQIAGIYLLLGVLWIQFSDQIASEIAPDQATLTQISIYKGWGYVLVTALLLYYLIRHHTLEISKAEWKLRESEENYREFLDQASDGIFISDANGRYIYVNVEACKLVGYVRDELLSMNIRDLVAPEELEDYPLRFDELRSGESLMSEIKLVRKDGSRILCEFSARMLPDGWLQSGVRDITERRISEDALTRSENRYRSLFENMTSGFARCQMVFDENGNPVDFIYLDVNNAFRKLPGLQDVIGRRITDLIPGIRVSNPEIFEIYGRVAMTGKPESFESYLPGLGSGIWFSVSAYCPERGFFVAVFEIITERKMAEEKLRESESRYRDLVQNANSAILRWKRDGTIAFFNEYAQTFFGYNNEEIIGRNMNILVPRTETTGGDLSNLVESIVDHPGQFINVVNENVCSDGRRVWVAWTNQPVYDENGRVTEIFAVGVDITERKRAEEALRRSHTQLLSFIEQAPLSIAMFDRDMNYLSVSHRWVVEYGRGRTDLIGRNHYDIHPDIPDGWKEAHRKGVSGESLRNDDDLWIQADGTKLWLRWAITPWVDENGDIGGIIISAEDISERKRAEAAAFQNQMRYHRVLDAMMEGCQIIDFEWRYVYVNDVVAEQGKYKPEELLNHTMMEMYPGIEKTELFATLERCMADREPRRMENQFVFPDGGIGWFELSIQPAQEGLFILSTDITERKKTEKTIHDLARFPEENPNPVLRAERDGGIIYANPGGHIWLKDWNITVGDPLPERWKELVIKVYSKGLKETVDISIRDQTFEAIFVPIKAAGYVNIYGRNITERKRAETALRESEERLRLSLQAANQGLYDLNVQTGNAVVNRQYAEMLGYDFETFEETNAAWIERLHPDDRDVTARAYSDYISGLTQEYRVEFRQKTMDGGWKWILSLGKVIEYDSGGKPLRMLGTHTDITERKLIEIELHDVLLNLEGAEEQAGLGSWYFDTHIDSGWWSKHMHKLFGLDPADDVPSNEAYLEMIHPEDRELLAVTLAQMAEGKPPKIEDFRTNPERGEVRILRPQYRIEKDRSGNILRFFGTVLDITEHRRAEQALQESKAKLDAALASMTDAVFITDRDGNFINFNDAFATFHKFRNKEECARTFVEYPDILDVYMDTGELAPVEMWAVPRALRGEIGTNVEYSLRRKDTGETWVGSYSFAPIRDENGAITGSVVVGRDVTDHKRAEEEIHRLNTELEQRVIERTSQLDAANKELEAFAYSVSHDLRAPLRAIDGFTKILVEDYEPLLKDEGKRVCGIISGETIRMGQLIDDLLSFSRLSRKEMHSEKVNMRELVVTVFDELTRNGNRERIEFQVGDIPDVAGDAGLLHQVWVNLIGNAIKFTSGKERVIVEVGGTQAVDENVYFVRDNGAGFEMEYSGKLFGVFQRLHSEKEFEGTGVGLAIVQRVVHRHGGRVWAEGKVDEGATFHFTLPRKGMGS